METARNLPQADETPPALASERPFYRCFFLHISGCVDKADIVEAASDEQALSRALRILESQAGCVAVEIWQGVRKVFPVTRARADAHQLRRAVSTTG